MKKKQTGKLYLLNEISKQHRKKTINDKIYDFYKKTKESSSKGSKSQQQNKLNLTSHNEYIYDKHKNTNGISKQTVSQ